MRDDPSGWYDADRTGPALAASIAKAALRARLAASQGHRCCSCGVALSDVSNAPEQASLVPGGLAVACRRCLSAAPATWARMQNQAAAA